MNKLCSVMSSIAISATLSVSMYAQENVLIDQQKYENMQAQFDQKDRDPQFLQEFALLAHKLRHNEAADNAVKEFLDDVPQEALLTKPNLEFLTRVSTKPTDAGFNVFYRNSTKVDRVLGEGAAERFIDARIEKTEIYPVALPDGSPSTTEPDWNLIQSTIAREYDTITAGRAVLETKTLWHWEKKSWPEFVTSAVSFIQKYGGASIRFDVVNACGDIYFHSSDKTQLTVAAAWVQSVLNREPDKEDNDVLWDTYANLQYKAGNVEEGIQAESKAIDADKVMIAKYGDRKFNSPYDTFNLPYDTFPSELKSHQETLAKMKRGEPTWTEQ